MDYTSCFLAAVITVVTTQISVSSGEGNCGANQSQFNGSCYHFSQNQYDFYTSKASCEKLGMKLVCIGSQIEQDFLVANLPDNASDYWIGLASVTWLDSSPLTFDLFRGFSYDFDEGGTCFSMYTPFPALWFDDVTIASHVHYYICEKEDAICDSTHIPFGGSCYYFSQTMSDFYTSKSFCGSLGMHLVFIGSQEEQDFLDMNQAPGTRSWIGLSPVRWLDGSNLTYANFGLTTSYFDDGGSSFFMNSSSSFQWYDGVSSYQCYFICEREVGEGSCSLLSSIKYGGSCYYFSNIQRDFSTSQDFCTSSWPYTEMHLVYIETQSEQNFLISNLPYNNEDYWIGLASVTWLDGSALTFDGFRGTWWEFNEGGACFTMETSVWSQWFDDTTNSSHVRPYACEKESVSCDSTYIEYDGSCYFFSQNQSNFYTSKSFCESLGMHLAYIGSQEEQDFLELNWPWGTLSWIGLSAVTWLDNSSLNYANFGSTSSPFDDAGISFRMKSSSSFQWFDDVVFAKHYYICENNFAETNSASSAPLPTQEVATTTPSVTFTIQSAAADSTSPTPTTQATSAVQTFTTPTTLATSTVSTSASSTNLVTAAVTTFATFTTQSTTSITTSTTSTTQATAAVTTSPTSTNLATAAVRTSTTPTTQSRSTTTNSVRNLAHTRSSYFRLLFNDVALVGENVHSSYTMSTVIACGHACLEDALCSCFTFISRERVCLLARSCSASSLVSYQTHFGAKTYSTY